MMDAIQPSPDDESEMDFENGVDDDADLITDVDDVDDVGGIEGAKYVVAPTEMKTQIAIVGRPNVGKSTLFNILTETRKAVVRDQPGVTRDLQIEEVDLWGKNFDVIDTGGLTERQDVFSKLIKEQVSEFLSTVDLILFVVDGRSGLIPEDRDVMRLVKTLGKETLLIINKVDSEHEEDLAKSDFYEFGFDLLTCSFEQRRGLSTLLEWIHPRVKEVSVATGETIKLSIVGKPNAGKSSLCNALLGMPRLLVSEIAGTTVDAIEVPFRYETQDYILVDTAGLRRSARREEDVEIISAFKSQEAIRRCDIAILVIDGELGPSDQDAKILELLLDAHKGVVVALNKSDLGKEIPQFRKTLLEKMDNEFHFIDDLPIVFTSAKNHFGLGDLMNSVNEVAKKLTTRIPTSDLNDFFFDTIRKAPAPVWGNNNVKFYYITQTQQVPPSFIAFANHPNGVSPSYRRFLIKHMKDRFDLRGVPIRVFCMKSKSKE